MRPEVTGDDSTERAGHERRHRGKEPHLNGSEWIRPWRARKWVPTGALVVQWQGGGRLEALDPNEVAAVVAEAADLSGSRRTKLVSIERAPEMVRNLATSLATRSSSTENPPPPYL
jgi:hypothetical protein